VRACLSFEMNQELESCDADEIERRFEYLGAVGDFWGALLRFAVECDGDVQRSREVESYVLYEEERGGEGSQTGAPPA